MCVTRKNFLRQYFKLHGYFDRTLELERTAPKVSPLGNLSWNKFQAELKASNVRPYFVLGSGNKKVSTLLVKTSPVLILFLLLLSKWAQYPTQVVGKSNGELFVRQNNNKISLFISVRSQIKSSCPPKKVEQTRSWSVVVPHK